MSRRADYEGRVLRSMLLYPEDLLIHILHRLDEKDFSSPAYRQAYRIVKALAKTDDQIDSIKLTDALQDANYPISQILDSWGSHYTKHNIADPIKAIRRRSRLKQMNQLHKKWAENTTKLETKVDSHITEVMGELYKMRVAEDGVSGQDMLQKIYNQWDRYAGQRLYGVETGLNKLDFITMGCQPQHLWLIGGYTSVGKSWLGTRIVNAHLEQDIPVLWLSFEMSSEELWWRLSVQSLGRMTVTLNKAKQKDLDMDALRAFENKLKDMSEKPIYTIDHLSTWDETRMALNYYIYSHGVKCIVVDYVQNIIGSGNSEYENLNLIVRELQKMAVKNDVFICAFSQMNRESVKEDEEYVFGFKGSGNLENAADIAMILKSANSDRTDPRRKLIIGKNRSGQTGEVFLYTNFSYGYINEVEEKAWKEYQKPSTS